jgi:5-methylcytosine-specific restriction endonuclease McrA
VARKRRRKSHGLTVKRWAYKRAKGLCRLCGQPLGNPRLVSLDHVKPLSRGGYDRRKNLQATHQHCNFRKGAMTMGEWQKQTSQV